MSPTNDPTWYGEIFRRLVLYFRKNIRHAEAAPDLAQEVLLAALRSVDMETLEKPDSYLMTAAAKLAGQQRLKELWERDNLRSLSDPDTPDTPDHRPQSPEPLIFPRALQRAVDKLTESSQEILALWLTRCTYEEIADAKSLTTDQVHRDLQETLALLRSLLNDDPDPTERN